MCLIADTSNSGARVGPEFDALVRLNCKPAGIVSDNGTYATAWTGVFRPYDCRLSKSTAAIFNF
jgi:hypothetical protein